MRLSGHSVPHAACCRPLRLQEDYLSLTPCLLSAFINVVPSGNVYYQHAENTSLVPRLQEGTLFPHRAVAAHTRNLLSC